MLAVIAFVLIANVHKGFSEAPYVNVDGQMVPVASVQE